MQVAFQNDNCSLFSPPKKQGAKPVSISSKTEGSESEQIAYEVANQFAIADHSRGWNNTTTQEDGAATRQLY